MAGNSKGNVHAYMGAVTGTWITIPTQDKEFGALEVMVRPQPLNTSRQTVMGDLLGIVCACVMDWKLHDNGKKIECTEENKAKYLDMICTWPAAEVKYSKGVAGKASIGSELLAFCGNFDNFTKN